jgi:hypothetical protein
LAQFSKQITVIKVKGQRIVQDGTLVKLTFSVMFSNVVTVTTLLKSPSSKLLDPPNVAVTAWTWMETLMVAQSTLVGPFSLL